MAHRFTSRYVLVLVITVLVALASVQFSVLAQETEFNVDEAVARENELNILIAGRSDEIQKLEAEINGFKEQLKQIGGQKNTLQNEIKSLDITRKKLEADLSVTENKITRTTYQLESLAIEINDNEYSANTNRYAIAKGLRILNEYDQKSFVEGILDTRSLVRAWEDIDAIQSIQNSLRAKIETLVHIKIGLESQQTETAKIKNELTKLRTQLANQKQVVSYNTKQKNTLLATTKNSEANYQRLLTKKRALRDAFEQELLDFESQLKLLKDASSIPEARYNMLSWPLESIFITQYFGNTKFAQSNPQIYNGKGHNGIDFRASIGTPVKSARDGEVIDTGNTDTVCPDASYGKWALIRHQNGLSTLYAHLSVISVSSGQSVSTGDVIGYSGNTGYSTGPHLHFTLYASQGVEIMDRKSFVCKGTYRMPVADLKAYLNPLGYLPELP